MRRLSDFWRRRPRHPQQGERLGDAEDVLILTAPGLVEPLTQLDVPAGAETHRLTDPGSKPRVRDAVVLVASDLVSLRRCVTGLPHLGSAHRVGVVLQRPVARLPVPGIHPSWPQVDELVASRTPSPRVELTFASPVMVRQVLQHIARAAAPSGTLAVGWPALGVRRQAPSDWPPADPSTTVAGLPRLLDQSGDFPPDLVLVGPAASGRSDLPSADHPVLGRATRVAIVEPAVTWPEWEALAEGERDRALAARGPSSLGAIDEGLVNPIGFDRDPEGAVATLADVGTTGGLAVDTTDTPSVLIDPEHGLSDGDLPDLRRLAGVRLDWLGGAGPQSYCRVVAGLAMAGVPLVTDAVPAWAKHLLAPDLVAALQAPVDLTDRQRREEHSVLLRRAALRGHGTRPWRSRLAEEHGLQRGPAPRVSVLLATRRPSMLDFALRQVGRQRGVEIEVVLACHGYDPDPAVLDRFRHGSGTSLSALTLDASLPFGEVLNAAAARASGDLLLKMDDDDWYGPDFVADLLLAQRYSGAQVVGCPAEFTYLAPRDVTTRGAQPTESYRPVVAGGTMLLDRGLFTLLGGFRHTARYVDASLLAAAARSGAATYRTHGLSYVLRRAAEGHTWDPGLGYFLEAHRAVEQWEGFRPSTLLAAAAEDHPAF